MRRSYIIARIGAASYQLDIAHRDLGMVVCQRFEEGLQFIKTLGVYDHFTLARGLPKGSFVIRERRLLLDATELFLRAVERDEELLRYDYSYSFSTQGNQRNQGAQSGIRIRGLFGHISTRPHGFCWLELWQLVGSEGSRVVESIDMRVRGSIETDELGTLKIHRRKAETHWLESLPQFVEFLHTHKERDVRIEHYEETA